MKDTETARSAALDLNSRAAEKDKKRCEWPAGAWPEPQTNPQKNELGHQLAAHDALGVLADVQDGPFDTHPKIRM